MAKKTLIELFWPGYKMHVIIQHVESDWRQISFGMPPVQHLIEEKVLINGSISKIAQVVDAGVEPLLRVGMLQYLRQLL